MWPFKKKKEVSLKEADVYKQGLKILGTQLELIKKSNALGDSGVAFKLYLSFSIDNLVQSLLAIDPENDLLRQIKKRQQRLVREITGGWVKS